MNRTLLSVMAAMVLLAGVPAQAQDRLRTIYMHGMPYSVTVEEAHARSTEELVDLLRDTENSKFWVNAAKVLGFAGGMNWDDYVVEDLISFIEGNQDRGFSAEWSPTLHSGRTSAILALGYTANFFGKSNRAMDYLMFSVHADAWDSRDVLWLKKHPRMEALREELCSTAALGLALTGHPKAADKLDAVAGDETMNPRLRSVARSARVELGKIEKMGLEAYHRLGE